MRAILVAAFMLLLAAPASAKGQPQPLTFHDYGGQVLQIMDTQPAVNMTGCVANDQDSDADLGTGDVEAGQTVDDSLCVIADYGSRKNSLYPKVAVFRVYAPGDTLNVTVSNDVGDTWASPASVPYGNLRLWALCVRDTVAQVPNLSHYSELPAYWPLVPDSDIYGQRVTYTLHVSSPVRKTRNVTAYFEVAHGDGPGPARATYQTPCP